MKFPRCIPAIIGAALVVSGADLMAEDEQAAKWQDLFDGKTMKGWRGTSFCR